MGSDPSQQRARNRGSSAGEIETKQRKKEGGSTSTRGLGRAEKGGTGLLTSFQRIGQPAPRLENKTGM